MNVSGVELETDTGQPINMLILKRSKHAFFFCSLDELHAQAHRSFVPGDRFDADGVRSLLPNIHANPKGAEDPLTRALRNLKAVRPSEFALNARLLDEYRTRFAD